MLYVIATLRVKPEKRADFIQNARDVITATRRETGCQSYDLTNNVIDADEFVFVERWDSRDSLEAHFRAPHLAHWRNLCQDYLLAKGVVEIIRPETVDVL